MRDDNAVEPLQRPDVLTPEKKAHVDRYTIETRNEGERIFTKPPLKDRLAVAFENVNRRFWYTFFKRAFNNPAPAKKIPISQLESLLIVPYGDAVGDMIVALPIVDAVKRRNPKTRIGVVTSPRNESLLRCEPGIDKQYSFIDRFDWKHYPELFKARKDSYQVLLNIHFARMTEYGLVANVMAPNGIKVSVTHQKRKNYYRALFNHLSDILRFRVHLTQLSLRLLDDVVEFDPPLLAKESRLRLNICPDTFSYIEGRVNNELASHNAKWFIYLNPEARNPFREMGPENLVDFCRRFTAMYPEAMVFITSSPVRQAEMREMIQGQKLERVVFFQTTYDLLEVASLCRLAKVVITPDTSVIHFAAAERSPSVVLWADRNTLPIEWLPLHTPSIQLAPPNFGEPVSTLPVEEILSAVADLIDGRVRVSYTSYDRTAPLTDSFQSATEDQELMPLIEPHITKTKS
jgi:ADP-heptose:LPS heptosyltransferase